MSSKKLNILTKNKSLNMSFATTKEKGKVTLDNFNSGFGFLKKRVVSYRKFPMIN